MRGARAVCGRARCAELARMRGGRWGPRGWRRRPGAPHTKKRFLTTLLTGSTNTHRTAPSQCSTPALPGGPSGGAIDPALLESGLTLLHHVGDCWRPPYLPSAASAGPSSGRLWPPPELRGPPFPPPLRGSAKGSCETTLAQPRKSRNAAATPVARRLAL